MIVGCAGAGKTTLLKRLQRLGKEELKLVHSTVGLEVHEDLFEIRFDLSLAALSDDSTNDEKQILSVMDFGGQCAYYACHQIYLSRRAFYLLVIDMSKSFKEKVDESLCEQRGTMFADWTYGEYVLFWLKSVHTYCAEDTSIIVVATHTENATLKDKEEFYGQLLDLIPTDSKLKKHFKYERCFFVGFHNDNSGELEHLSELENCIVSIAKDRRWKETIPEKWSIIEMVLIKFKNDSEKIVTVEELIRKYWVPKKDEKHEKGEGIKVALRFFHDIGTILYFDEEKLSDKIVVDVQWFVDTFKFIISDKNHVRDLAGTNKDWNEFHRTGYLIDSFLCEIWKSLSIDLWYKSTILHYMQRLGLIAIGKIKHYVPCMNKRDFGKKEQTALRKMETKSSVLVLHFNFLPFFFYCRLIVACIVGTKWEAVEDGAPRYDSTTISQDFIKLEEDGKLSVNNYGTLKTILENVDQRACQRVVECEEELSKLL
ncbi:probable serine/threonine-protein kinase roco4 [Saccostrea echinata]|uniref:probable serine/threonine-protein kinase roco4 n=1 Tax=Saccostrea echinata TaxID=191078 RepID=UPI002A81EDE0|nr:probable serine/threonine-protein kinase roco4 [Saccostrea echinata]